MCELYNFIFYSHQVLVNFLDHISYRFKHGHIFIITLITNKPTSKVKLLQELYCWFILLSDKFCGEIITVFRFSSNTLILLQLADCRRREYNIWNMSEWTFSKKAYYVPTVLRISDTSIKSLITKFKYCVNYSEKNLCFGIYLELVF